MTALSIVSLTKGFYAGAPGCSARVRVLRDLDLALWPGEVVALEGMHGSGTSTLLRCAAGLLRSDAGSILWFGARACPRERVAYVGRMPATPSRDTLLRLERRSRGGSGALYAALERALAHRVRLLLVDDLPFVGVIERRLVLALLQPFALAGTAVLFTANEELASAPFVSRVVTLVDGALAQRRKRSAARIAASSPAAAIKLNAQYSNRD